jgi:hypothetical protein
MTSLDSTPEVRHMQMRPVDARVLCIAGSLAGTGFTTPSLSIFSSQVDAGAFFSGVSLNVNATPAALGDMFARANLLGDMAKSRSSHVAEYVSTPLVARDMLSMLEAYGSEKLQYWGLS